MPFFCGKIPTNKAIRKQVVQSLNNFVQRVNKTVQPLNNYLHTQQKLTNFAPKMINKKMKAYA
nr:MAG TPA: hypothetical protein [Caudoviricetes sp.]